MSFEERFRKWKGSEKSGFSANVGEIVGNVKLARVAALALSEADEDGFALFGFVDVGRAKGLLATCKFDFSWSLMRPSMSIIAEDSYGGQGATGYTQISSVSMRGPSKR